MRLHGLDAIGFDLDGTLLDHPHAARTGAAAVFAALGAPLTDALFERWSSLEAQHYGRWLAGELTFDEQRAERMRGAAEAVGAAVSEDDVADLGEVYVRAYQSGWRLYPEVAQTLTRLREEGLRIGVLTNGDDERQREKISGTGLDGLLDVVCTSEVLGVAKPDPRAFAALVAALETNPDRMVFVGDHADADIAGARGAGIRAARVRAAGRTMAELGSAVRRAAALPPLRPGATGSGERILQLTGPVNFSPGP